MLEYLNILSSIIAFIAAGYLFITSKRLDKELKTATVLMATGVLIAAAIHSLAEVLEAFNYLDTKTLSTIMPILILIGSIFLILGTNKLHNIIKEA
jgi:uncharacterized membrane protein YjjP (DUF1212 family)